MKGIGAGAAAGLAGCLGGGGGGGGSGPQDIEFWAFGGIPAEREYIKAHNQDFEKHNVTYTHQAWGKKFEIVASAASSNSLPHVMAGQELLIPDYADIQAIQPLDHDAYADRLSTLNDRFVGANIDALTYAGLKGHSGTRQWGLPGGYADLGAFIDIHEDLLADAGYDSPPRTWSELVEYGQAMQDLDGVDAGIVTSGTDFGLTTGYFIGLVYQNGGRYFDPETLKATVNQPGFVDAVGLYEDIAGEGLFPDAIVEMNHIDAGRFFLEKKAGIFIVFSHANAIYQTIDAPQPTLDGEGHIVTRAPLPDDITGQFEPQNLLLQNAQGHMLGTGEANDAERDAAFDFIEWWNQPEQLAPWTYDPDNDVGIRGRVPTLKSAFEDPHPLMEKQFGDLVTLYGRNELFTKTTRFPSFAGLDAIQSQLNRDVLQPVMLGNKGAQEALDAVQPKIQGIIDDKLKG